MRLWSVHPSYLDAKGLVALWREGLLAQNVLAGKTKGYKHHPQLVRFKAHHNPMAAMEGYLHWVGIEADKRGYHFKRTKINATRDNNLFLTVTLGQLRYEFAHLSRKLKLRSTEKLATLPDIHAVQPHPLFLLIEGDIEPWEVR